MRELFYLFRYLFVSVIFFSLMIGDVALAYAPVSAAIVVDAKTGEIVYSYNSDRLTQPASLVKMMTLLIIFKMLQQKKILPSTMITISPNAASQKPCTLGLKAGKTISVKNAILALITKSANDIAVALAEHIGKNEKFFVARMNKEARRLGMRSTLFLNPSGWKNPRQLTTVTDMAKLARALYTECPGYYHLFATKQFLFNNQCFKNHNELLGKKDGIIIDGIKTGFLNSSGFNLAASASKGRQRLIVVVFGGRTPKERDMQVNLLLHKGFSRLSRGKKLSMRGIVEAGMSSRKKMPPSDGVGNERVACGIYNQIYNSVPNRKD